MSKAVSIYGLWYKVPKHPLKAASPWQSLRVASLHSQLGLLTNCTRALHTDAAQANDVPFRKQLKDEAKRKRQAERSVGEDCSTGHRGKEEQALRLDKWKLTVGLEIHAQLNTERKLFSTAKASDNDLPNSNIALFDLALPGSQPEFQKATLIPAIRAALGLSCNIQRESRFDRKHYYYQDQPAGYQITQYYKPFAVDGRLTLYDHDGIAPEDGQSVDIGIKQIQMEQDTAKTTLQPPSMAMLDFNRVGHPLIEIITHPQIHHVQTASACARKIQLILQAVNAVTTGMELGGLRADVNVSVSPKDSESLGQRTEIKNLSSFKAVEDAIVAERDRQIMVLESGGLIEGETRGWTLGSTETKKLRGKEGEVDYRYMPDPDILPLIIGQVCLIYLMVHSRLLMLSPQDLTYRIENSMPDLPDDILKDLTTYSGLTSKDAKTLMVLDDGERLDYFDDVKLLWSNRRASNESVVNVKHAQRNILDNVSDGQRSSQSRVANAAPVFDKIVANWYTVSFSPRILFMLIRSTKGASRTRRSFERSCSALQSRACPTQFNGRYPL